MIDSVIRDQYTATIGIECHVQLKTKTKLFSSVSNDARDVEPNTLVSHIDLGMPGALPVLNEKAVELAMKAAFALNTKPQPFSKFDRKHYFYPDLPKGYQISQFDEPIILGGYVDIVVDGKTKRVHITRAHMEEDAGKSTHPMGKDYSLVDLNRAGTPLLEVVSEPEIHTPAEARAFARELWLLMRYAEVSDADLYHGNMRFDVNVSVSKNETLGTRTETKNLNSFKSVERAVEYEINRQITLLEKGEAVAQETRGWDDTTNKTISQRTKEDAHDYRYFPDPDLPPIVLDEAAIHQVAATMPPLPDELRNQFNEHDLKDSVIETLVENIPAGMFMHDLLEHSINSDDAKKIANWLTTDVQALISNDETLDWEQLHLNTKQFLSLLTLVNENKVSSTGAKTILATMIISKEDPEQIAEAQNLLQVSDENEIAEIVATVLRENEQAAKDVKGGEMKAIGFLVGQVMKASRGKANPSMAQSLIKKQLGL